MNGKAERAMLAHWLVRTSRAALFQTRPALICRAGIFRAGPVYFCRPGFLLPARLFFAGPVFRLLGRLFFAGPAFFCRAGFFLPGRLLPDRLAQTGPVVKSRAHPAFGRLSLHFARLWLEHNLIKILVYSGGKVKVSQRRRPFLLLHSRQF